MTAKLILKKTSTGFYLWRNPLDKSQELLGATVPIMNDNGVDLRKYKLSLKNCQAIENGYDMDELALEFCYTGNGVRDKFQPVFRGVFKDGFRKALEILGDKKFSDEDVILIAEYIRVASQSTPSVRTKDLFNEYQSLQQTEWDVNLNPEEKDSEGCLILKRL